MFDNYNIILGSGSPRRKELLQGLGLEFQVLVRKGISEEYPADMPAQEVSQYIAEEKAAAYTDLLDDPQTLVITADTVVICDGQILGKPADTADARRMLAMLGGKTHQVTTGVCIETKEKKVAFHVTTDVTFKQLTDDEIYYYINNYRPFDKAGAYGIQEWIGYIGVTAMNGSYFNVMGLPVQRIYQTLVDEY
jgi:septum formation protein